MGFEPFVGFKPSVELRSSMVFSALCMLRRPWGLGFEAESSNPLVAGEQVLGYLIAAAGFFLGLALHKLKHLERAVRSLHHLPCLVVSSFR